MVQLKLKGRMLRPLGDHNHQPRSMDDSDVCFDEVSNAMGSPLLKRAVSDNNPRCICRTRLDGDFGAGYQLPVLRLGVDCPCCRQDPSLVSSVATVGVDANSDQSIIGQDLSACEIDQQQSQQQPVFTSPKRHRRLCSQDDSCLPAIPTSDLVSSAAEQASSPQRAHPFPARRFVFCNRSRLDCTDPTCLHSQLNQFGRASGALTSR